MKIAKHIQQAGLASRRQAETWVLAGRVCVDGKIMENPAHVVAEGARILLDGKPLPPAPQLKLWRYHKPAGLLVSRSDPEGRATIFSNLPKDKQNLIAVGRLDMSSEGLLLLTNNGALARILELPQTKLIRSYRVRVFGNVSQAKLDRLAEGMVVNRFRYAPVVARLEAKKSGRNQWISIQLTEGKNREVRHLMEALDLKVSRLLRLGYGPFHLGRLPKGGLAVVPEKQLQDLQKKLSPCD